ncbi:MAG: DUF1266 domain-containing protein [Gordonia sp. (in: high G+C Gram-positive bacteria)]|uniref:DUF1266 domain-containing protein n=1 Tax=Gordonia sp. (in: high G+C Gram-positive bacteria) TaxID=84139 RepID=UPI0039E3FAE4
MGLLDSFRKGSSSADDDYTASTPEEIDAAIRRDYSEFTCDSLPHGPLYGPLAQGLAVICPLSVSHGGWWNSLKSVGHHNAAEGLELYGATDPESWMEILNRLVNASWGDSVAYHATAIRTRYKRARDLPTITDADWAAALDAEAQRLEAPADYAAALRESIPGIRHAEDRGRQSQLLGADEEAEALDGYDFMRAGAVAKWGVNVGWGEEHVVANVAMICRDAASQLYTGWREYAIGCNVGRIVTYPDTWGNGIADSLLMMRPLLDNPESPWNNIPFPAEPVMPPEPDQTTDPEPGTTAP